MASALIGAISGVPEDVDGVFMFSGKQRVFKCGRGTFTDDNAQLTIPPARGISGVASVQTTDGAASMSTRSYSIGTTGIVTITRGDTVSNAEISYLIVYI